MKLERLIEAKGIEGRIPDVDVSDITADSRQVHKGSLFFAAKGSHADGTNYVDDAIKRGVAAIICDHQVEISDKSVPIIKADNIRHRLAIAAARFYGAQPEAVAAVTGTSGKTSVASFLRQIWMGTGFSAASIGTVGVKSDKYTQYGSLTTPDPVTLQALLKRLSDDGVTHVALEASSHGIDQCRMDGVRLASAAFTNLGRDHMDYHATVDDYFKAKMRLFDTLLPRDAPAVIFADDVFSERAIAHVKKASRQVLSVGRRGNFIKLKRVEQEQLRQYVEIEIDGRTYEFMLPLAGCFQVSNALVAAGLAITTGVVEEAVVKMLERLHGAPGRLQMIGATPAGARVYVDYAHKPEALENVLSSLRAFTRGRLIVVFGCGGDRDKGKRPIMGKIATDKADIVIVTDDNPRSEDAKVIRREILDAAPDAMEIADRREAIQYAVGMLREGDTLVVAGKGHENGQIIGSQTFPFSDEQEALYALDSIKS